MKDRFRLEVFLSSRNSTRNFVYFPSGKEKKFHMENASRLPSAPIFPIFSYIFRASYFFLYFDPESYIFPSNSYIFQNAADNNEIARKNHGILV